MLHSGAILTRCKGGGSGRGALAIGSSMRRQIRSIALSNEFSIEFSISSKIALRTAISEKEAI
jgi:hypothetical protein